MLHKEIEMYNKFFFVILCLISISFSSTAIAEGDESISLFPGILGTSCGPGWKVNSQTTWVGITTRSMTNLTSSSSFAVTSGTSGCEKHNFVKKYEIDGVYYAHYNYENLIEEMAMGGGEHLYFFAKSYGCSDSSQDVFNQLIQKKFNSVVPVNYKKPVTLYRNIKEAIKSNPVLQRDCEALI